MGFLPFVNQGGKRVVRWHRLVLCWIAVISAALFGSCAMGYLLTRDWRNGAFTGMAMGVTFAAVITVQGFTLPVDALPPEPGPSLVKVPGLVPRDLRGPR
jgi:hypothetical protein